jgi:VanZ family protein
MMNYFQVKHIKNLLEHRYFYLWLAELWTFLIAYLCLTSAKDLPNVQIINKMGLQSIDKYVHFTLHFVFSALWFQYLKNKDSNQNKPLQGIFAKVLLASFIYGVLIEIAQSLFTTTRQGDVLDVMANTSGAVMAIGILFLRFSYFNRKV